MAFLSGNIYSKSLLMDTHINVFLPQDGRRYIWEQQPKTLILLHGLSDDYSVWSRKTAVERYAEKHNLAVVMPEAQRSFYHDMKNGHKFFTYIAEELPNLLRKMFLVSVARDDLMVAGLSMGGYGALRCALSYPERFGYCGAFSGAYDIKLLLEAAEKTPEILAGFKEDLMAIFGEEMIIPESSKIPFIAKEAKNKPKLPKLYLTCGTEDFIYEHTVQTHKTLDDLGIQHIYEEFPGYHEWDVWDISIERMLGHFLGEGRADWI